MADTDVVAVETPEAAEPAVEVLVVTSRIKARVKARGLRTSDDAVLFLSKKVEEMVERAITKVLATDRKTIKDTDLL